MCSGLSDVQCHTLRTPTKVQLGTDVESPTTPQLCDGPVKWANSFGKVEGWHRSEVLTCWRLQIITYCCDTNHDVSSKLLHMSDTSNESPCTQIRPQQYLNYVHIYQCSVIITVVNIDKHRNSVMFDTNM
jgi:hypothetical protein